MKPYNEQQPQDEEQQTSRLDARPKNNIYAPGTGPLTGHASIRVGTRNRDGSISPVDAMGAATGPLSQPLPRLNPNATSGDMSEQEQAGNGGFGSRPGRIDARPRNNVYAPGTGPGTGRTAIRVGTRNRDGSISPVDAMGAATGPLSQPLPKLFTPRPTPAEAYAQRQGNVAQAKANGSFDATRDKFNAANPGHTMDSSGTITKKSGDTSTGAPGAPPAGTPSPDAGAAASMHDSMSPPAGQDRNGRTVNSPSAQGAPPPPPGAGAPVSSSAAGYWQSGSPNTRAISSQYGTGASNITPHGAAAPADPVLPKDKPSTGYIDGKPSSEAFADLAKSQGKSNAFANAPSAAPSTPAPGAGQTAPPPATGQTPPAPGADATAPDSGADKTTPTPGADATAATPPSSSTPQAPDAESTTPPEASGSEAASEPDDPEKDKSALPPGRAKGGPVRAGRPYLVGEKGPEIIVPQQSGSVVPNHAIPIATLMAMKRAGKNIVLPKGVPGAKFFETRLPPQWRAGKSPRR